LARGNVNSGANTQQRRQGEIEQLSNENTQLESERVQEGFEEIGAL
jgi:hypothetical protein